MGGRGEPMIRLGVGFLAAVSLVGGAMTLSGCGHERPVQSGEPDWAALRNRMVSEQIEARGVRDPRVLKSLRTVPRHEFVHEAWRDEAYRDSPLPIGDGQTISQPYIVAFMSELLEVGPGEKVLEIGTGSGYQAAVLGGMGVEVFTIEIRQGLCRKASETLERLGYRNVHVRCGDGYGGWPEQAPFDGIVVTAAPERVPEPLLEQLKEGGRMVIPVGAFYQELKVITRTQDGFQERSVIPVRFVPMTGEIERTPPS